MPNVKPSQTEAVQFGISVEDRVPASDLMSNSIMGSMDKVQPRVWLAVGIAGVLLALVLACGVTACIVSMGR